MFGLRDHLRQIVKYFKSGPWKTSSLNTRIVYFIVRNGVRSCMRLTFAFQCLAFPSQRQLPAHPTLWGQPLVVRPSEILYLYLLPHLFLTVVLRT